MRRTFVLFFALASCFSALEQKVLTDDDIIKMLKGGLSDDVIVLAIESQPSNFDISAEALIELKLQGASKAVLDKILEVAAMRQHAAFTAVQEQPQVKPPASATGQALSPADEQKMCTLMEQALSQSRRLLGQPMQQNLHELLDQGLNGGDLPTAFKRSFVAVFGPHRQALHQVVDQEVPRLRQQLSKPSGPRSNLNSPSPVLRPILWTGGKVFPDEVEPDAMVGSRWPSVSPLYGDSTLLFPDSQPCGEKSSSGSKSLGDTNITFTLVDWEDTPESIAWGSGAEMDIIVDPKVPVKGTKSGKLSTGHFICACVNRCPTADGKVAGKFEFVKEKIVEVTSTTGVVASDRDTMREEFTAEAHVGDDAMLSDVVVQGDWNTEKRAGSDLTIFRYQGTATFDAHGTESDVPLQLTGCSWNQGAIPVAQCTALGLRPVFTTSVLREAYLRAEKKWNFLDEEGGSKCVIAKFTPPTGTIKGSPRQRVPLKAELIAVKGNQPTRGVFNEFRQITGDGDTQANGARTSAEDPAQLTYTAPSQQWPCNDPPGFGVYRATSRAGVLKDGGQLEEEAGLQYTDWTWFLAPGCLRLSVHERAEANLGVFSYLSDVTFPMDLLIANDKHQVVGQAVVSREGRSLTMQGFCQGVDHWTENWHASGTLDEKTDTLTLKLWFEASPKQGVNVCQGPVVGSDAGPVGPPGAPITTPYTGPGFRSDAFRSPLDQFTLPDKDGAAQHFVIP